MQITGRATKVTIYVGEADRWQGRPLHSAILEMLRQEGCAGATVMRAVAGFGAHSRIHTAGIVRLSEDLALVIQWVDDPKRVERVLPQLQEMVQEGLITVQPVEVVSYTQRRLRDLPAAAPVGDVMSQEVKAIDAETPVSDVVALFLSGDYRGLPVVDSQGRVMGMLTDGDLVRRAGLLTTSLQRQLSREELVQELQTLRADDQAVADVMTPQPITVAQTTPITQAVHLMIQHGIKRLPVVDSTGRLQGMVSRVDVLRALAQAPVAEAGRTHVAAGHKSQVAEVMDPQVLAVPVEAPLDQVVNLLVSSRQRRVVVVDGQRRVLGIITDADLLRSVSGEERSGVLQALLNRLPLKADIPWRLGERQAGEIMTRAPITVGPQTALAEALQLLLRHKIKRLPVVDERGRLVGLVGRGAILEALSQEI